MTSGWSRVVNILGREGRQMLSSKMVCQKKTWMMVQIWLYRLNSMNCFWTLKNQSIQYYRPKVCLFFVVVIFKWFYLERVQRQAVGPTAWSVASVVIVHCSCEVSVASPDAHRKWRCCHSNLEALAMKNLKDSALFPANVSAFFPALFRNHSGKRPEKHRKQAGIKAETFSGKRA